MKVRRLEVKMSDTSLIVVTLDVGGVLFRTTKATLCSVDGYFAAMFNSENEWQESIDLSSPVFVDRDSTVFASILSYLRTHKTIFLSKESNFHLQLLLIEADFYQYSSLSKAIVDELCRRKQEAELSKSASNGSNNTLYKVVSEIDAPQWFDRGWSFVSQYHSSESYGCSAIGPTYQVAFYETLRNPHTPNMMNNGPARCSVCHEIMHNYERFLKHTVLFTPCKFVLSKSTTSGSRLNSLSANQDDISSTIANDDAEYLATLIAQATQSIDHDN